MDGTADELARRLARGDASAYAQLYDRWAAELRAWLALLLGNPSDAEDALQAAMLRLVRHRRHLLRVRALKAYVFRTARNEALRERRRRRPVALEDALLDTMSVPAPGSDGDTERLLCAVARLPRERREVVALKTWHGLTFAEIGTVLQCSPNTAASRWRLALADLQRTLEEECDVVR